MRKLLLTTTLVSALSAAPLVAQTTDPAVSSDGTASSGTTANRADMSAVTVPEGFNQQDMALTADDLLGATLYDVTGDSIGEVVDLVLHIEASEEVMPGAGASMDTTTSGGAGVSSAGNQSMTGTDPAGTDQGTAGTTGTATESVSGDSGVTGTARTMTGTTTGTMPESDGSTDATGAPISGSSADGMSGGTTGTDGTTATDGSGGPPESAGAASGSAGESSNADSGTSATGTATEGSASTDANTSSGAGGTTDMQTGTTGSNTATGSTMATGSDSAAVDSTLPATTVPDTGGPAATGTDSGGMNSSSADQGQPTHAVLDIGGFLGIGVHSVAVPVSDLAIYSNDSETRVYLPWTREQIEALPEYDADNPDSLGRSGMPITQ
ncbi:PRC-barrel domain-containing protein [Szabonella alba]|uniref:PRC-barrel domain-containing protein n=1 Tax=Szabonella alba TaxID=2804194 RepID=A0A8K0VH00_9RHOB|nr:PRC-barrel domain-containing protein [Szabonella alba]MBL4918910.1 hypothetical protein [Szabonella alba]